MKGVIKPGHIPTNNMQLLILGLPPITAVTISGLEDELQTTELPDRTRASGGNRGPSTITLGVPLHHTVEQLAIEAHYKESQSPVSPSYKKPASLIFKDVGDKVARTFTLTGVFPMKRTLPEGEMENEGEMATVEWEFSVDDILPI